MRIKSKPHRGGDGGACLFLAAALVMALLAGCGKGQPSGQGVASGGVEAATAKSNQQVAQTLDLANQQDFEDATRGLIARPSGKLARRRRLGAGATSTPSSSSTARRRRRVNPSLWRQAKLNAQIGLFKVTDGIWQLRGFDIANMTLIEGKTGWIVVDTLTARESATAALAFARKHLGDKPVSAIDLHAQPRRPLRRRARRDLGARRSAERKMPVVAPEGFMEEATSENVLVGTAMARRSIYQFGKDLRALAQGPGRHRPGQGVAYGARRHPAADAADHPAARRS